MVIFKKKNKEHNMDLKTSGDIVYLTFPLLEESGLVKQGFSTRMGGVSKDEFATMNFTTIRGDSEEAVKENYRRMADTLDVDFNRLTLSYQTHTTNIRRIEEEDAGKGMIRERDYEDIDGLITNVPEITLVTFYADCIPLYFLDPVNKAIGLSHSGWRGTTEKMAVKTIEAMRSAFGSKPEELLVGIGPGICRDCFEVGAEVVEEFKKVFPPESHKDLFDANIDGKYQLDLWKANEWLLLNAGVSKDHICLANICTCCNPELLFSHRASGGKRGNLAAFLTLKDEKRATPFGSE